MTDAGPDARLLTRCDSCAELEGGAWTAGTAAQESQMPQPVSWPNWVSVPPRPRPPGHYTASLPQLVARALEDLPDL